MKIQLGILMLSLSFGFLAQAQEEAVDPRIGQAKEACIAGDFHKGVRLLAELYTASEDPVWIFNQGRCYQQNAQPSLAVSRFREFLRKSKGGPEDKDIREDAKKYIAEIEAEGHGAAPAPSYKPTDIKPTEVKPTGEQSTIPLAPIEQASQVNRSPSESLTSVPESTSPKPPIYKRWWFVTSVVAVVAAGTVTAILLARGSGDNACNGSIGPTCVELK
jgi:hypothetical protein